MSEDETSFRSAAGEVGWTITPLLWMLTFMAVLVPLVQVVIPTVADAQKLKFVLGADISALDAPSYGPEVQYMENGKPSDELTILWNHGWSAFRIRVFVSPVRDAPDNTVAAAIPLARRIKALGAIFLLDMHFSDTWADPQHQEIPVAWRGLSFDSLEDKWREYAYTTIKRFKDAGAMPDWVQIGNEITRGVAWPVAQLKEPGSEMYNPPEPYDSARQWRHLAGLLKAGIRGVKDAAGNTPPLIVIHIDQGGNWKLTKWFFDHLTEEHVSYDIIAESFYPPWHHGTLKQLWENMNECDKRYHKLFLVAETGYGPSHFPNNNDMKWPLTQEGRLQFMVDLVNTVREAPNGLGVVYWAPEYDLWNFYATPAPAVFTLDSLSELAKSPNSHAPAAVDSMAADR
jgi:arabinogalactan endo-1,4-beta-galactosidase